MEPSYTHTTIDYADDRINIWGNKRDKRDHEDGREDVGPLDGPVVDAIARQWAIADELVKATVHFEQVVTEPVERVDVTVTVEG